VYATTVDGLDKWKEELLSKCRLPDPEDIPFVIDTVDRVVPMH
jgi:hypothetical protein